MATRPVPWWLRAYLLISIALGILVMGISGLFVPAEVFIPIEVSPLDARFIGALYIAGGFGAGVMLLAEPLVTLRVTPLARASRRPQAGNP